MAINSIKRFKPLKLTTAFALSAVAVVGSQHKAFAKEKPTLESTNRPNEIIRLAQVPSSLQNLRNKTFTIVPSIVIENIPVEIRGQRLSNDQVKLTFISNPTGLPEPLTIGKNEYQSLQLQRMEVINGIRLLSTKITLNNKEWNLTYIDKPLEINGSVTYRKGLYLIHTNKSGKREIIPFKNAKAFIKQLSFGEGPGTLRVPSLESNQPSPVTAKSPLPEPIFVPPTTNTPVTKTVPPRATLKISSLPPQIQEIVLQVQNRIRETELKPNCKGDVTIAVNSSIRTSSNLIGKPYGIYYNNPIGISPKCPLDLSNLGVPDITRGGEIDYVSKFDPKRAFRTGQFGIYLIGFDDGRNDSDGYEFSTLLGYQRFLTK
ncbi:MAG: hypothetical protein QNJ31_02165 [Candidatus Caenarcaniphilales bacterium]|nr:hypothetical protein [Candidatus Caenarcaniphilales bacterium]